MASAIHQEDFIQGAVNYNREPLSPALPASARSIFNNLIDHCQKYREEIQKTVQLDTSQDKKGYNPVMLVDETYKHCSDQEAFLKHFFSSVDFMLNKTSSNFEKGLHATKGFLDQTHLADKMVLCYADDLLIFYLKMKTRASGSVSNTCHLSSEATPIKGRRQKLREFCLTREGHRCCVSNCFDEAEAMRRARAASSGSVPRDDEGAELNLLQREKFNNLEVAHIIPISIMIPPKNGSELTETQKFAISVLDMFNTNIAASIDGEQIDTPKNAITLSKQIHTDFGNFILFFDEVINGSGEIVPHVYTVSSYDDVLSSVYHLPKRVDFTKSPNADIDPPCPRLLKIHRAIAEILNLSGTGEYIDQILRDMEEPTIRADGATNVGGVVTWRLMDLI